LTAFLSAFGFGRLHDLSIDAAPDFWTSSSSWTIPARFFFGAVTSSAFHSGLRLWDLDNFAVNAAPPGRDFGATPLSLVLGTKTLELARLCIRCAHLHSVSVDADPALVDTATVARILFGSVPLTASLIAIRLAHRDDVHAGGRINAAPTAAAAAAASFARSVFGTVTLAVVPLAFFLRNINHFLSVASGHATPAHPTMRRCLFL
jgi:hypothetical protein